MSPTVRRMQIKSSLAAIFAVAAAPIVVFAQPNAADAIQSATAAIIELVGEEYFSRHISMRQAELKQTPKSCENPLRACDKWMLKPFYEVSFTLTIEIKADAPVKAPIRCIVDSENNVLHKYLSGVPDCINFPDRCQFPFDKQSALNIAAKNNFKKGIEPWTAFISWHPAMDGYVWKVCNLLFDNRHGGHGEYMSIDANNGIMLWTNTYSYTIN